MAKTKILAIVSLLLLLCNEYVVGNPMLYKKNPKDKYEADLVAVSSTVIPLSVLEVSYGLGGKPSESYKQAYLKKLRKKIQHQTEEEPQEAPDTLITIKTQKLQNGTNKAKVKGITNSN